MEKTMKKRFALFGCVALFALLISSCSMGLLEELPPAIATPKTISDGAHEDGNEHFYFLPPMVAQPTYSGTFDGSLSPVVQISGPNDFNVSLSVRVVPEDEHYIVNWHTDDLYDPGTDNEYRITVLVDKYELGYADMKVADSGRELKNIDTDEYVALKDGRTLPIKFRIEEEPFLEEVYVAAGTFQMGSTTGRANEMPVHTVTLTRSFYITKYEITQAQWQTVMGTNPSYFVGDNRPVEGISWQDEVEFCNALSLMEGLTPAYTGSDMVPSTAAA